MIKVEGTVREEGRKETEELYSIYYQPLRLKAAAEGRGNRQGGSKDNEQLHPITITYEQLHYEQLQTLSTP